MLSVIQLNVVMLSVMAPTIFLAEKSIHQEQYWIKNENGAFFSIFFQKKIFSNFFFLETIRDWFLQLKRSVWTGGNLINLSLSSSLTLLQKARVFVPDNFLARLKAWFLEYGQCKVFHLGRLSDLLANFRLAWKLFIHQSLLLLQKARLFVPCKFFPARLILMIKAKSQPMGRLQHYSLILD